MQGKGSIKAAKAVETEGTCGVFATKAVEPHIKGSALLQLDPSQRGHHDCAEQAGRLGLLGQVQRWQRRGTGTQRRGNAVARPKTLRELATESVGDTVRL